MIPVEWQTLFSDRSARRGKRDETEALQTTHDVALLQAFTGAAIAETGGCGHVHPGDIPHRLFNGNKAYRPEQVLSIWEDNGGVAGWALVLYALGRMAAAGMQFATVLNEGTNQAARNLYRACGFRPWHLLDGFARAP